MRKLLFAIYLSCIFVLTSLGAQAQDGDEICGKWMSAEHNLLVQVYRDNGDFKAKIIWFRTDDTTKPMEEWTDKHNPNPALRTRKILGMNVVQNLRYDTKHKTWEDGNIYDAQHGRTWDASAYLAKDGTLKVTGYWHFKFIGKTMTFNRANGYQAMSTH